MTVLWIIIGLVLLMVVWALVAANSGKAEVRTEPMAPTPMPMYETPERELPKAKHWQEAATASVSKNFGRGGAPTGVSKDIGGDGKKSANDAPAKVDEELERLKKARPFEPRATKIDID